MLQCRYPLAGTGRKPWGAFFFYKEREVYLLRAFSPIFIILFIALPIIGADLGKKHKLGAFIGALIGVISITIMLRFLPWKAYNPIFLVVFVVIGWVLGRQLEADKGIKSGAIKGTVISIIIAIVLYLPVDNFNLTAIFVWLGSIALGIILGKKINIGNGSGVGIGIAIGIVLDVVIVLFLLFGFSVY